MAMSIAKHRWCRLRNRWFAVAAVLVALAMTGPVRAHDSSGHATEESPPALSGQVDRAGQVDVRLLDLELVDRNGKPVKFESEAIADRIVAINFVYTTCTTICPVLSALFTQVQDQLGARLGNEVWLVSMSIDPIRDTPRRMAAEAQKFGAGPGWLWLTGQKNLVDRVLVGLGAYTPVFEDHPSMILIGDARRGVWRRIFGFPAPDDIVAVIDEFAAARGVTKTNVNVGE